MTITSSLGPDGYTVSIPAPVSGGGVGEMRRLLVALLGDSQTHNANQQRVPSAVTYTSGTGVLSITNSGHGINTGELINFKVTGAPQWNAYDAPVTRIDANNLSITLPTGISGSPTAANCLFGRPAYLVSTGIQSHLIDLSSGGLQVVRNAGVLGETIRQICNRVEDINGVDLDVVVMQGGHNDVNASTASTMFGMFMDLLTQYRGGKPVVVINMTPAYPGKFGGNDAANAAKTQEINALLATLPSAYPRRVAVVDAWTLANDPGNSGYAKAGATTDSLHWSGSLSRQVARLVVAAINTLCGTPSAYPLPISQYSGYDATTNPNSANRHANPLALTTTGGSLNGNPGSAASGFGVQTWVSASDTLASVVPTTGGAGNAQKFVGTPTGAGTGIRIDITSLATRFAPGQLIQFACRLTTRGLGEQEKTGSMSVQASATVDGVSSSFPIYNGGGLVANADQEDRTAAVVVSQPYRIPSGTSLTSLSWYAAAYLASAGSPIELEVSEVDVRVVT